MALQGQVQSRERRRSGGPTVHFGSTLRRARRSAPIATPVFQNLRQRNAEVSVLVGVPATHACDSSGLSCSEHVYRILCLANWVQAMSISKRM